MALPTTQPITPESAYVQVINRAQDVLIRTQAMKTAISNPIPVDNLIAYHNSLRAARTFGTSIQELPGLSDYAKVATNNPNYDLVASFMTTVTAGQAVTDWLIANLPHDGNGNYHSFTLANGDFSVLCMATDVLAPLSPLLDALINAITE